MGRTQVCTRGWNAAHNKIGHTVQNEVSSRYNIVAGPGTSLHLDQLIPASLGGDVTAPERLAAAGVAAEQEERPGSTPAPAGVCAGELPLATAQQAMADDWTSALRRYPPA